MEQREELKYNDVMKRIEEIVTTLEAGGTSLDETLKCSRKVTEGMPGEFEQAEKKIDGIRLDDSVDFQESLDM